MLSTTFSENMLPLAHTQYIKRKGFIKNLSCVFQEKKINHIFSPKTEGVSWKIRQWNHHAEAAEISFMISIIFLRSWSEPQLLRVNCVLFVMAVIVLHQLQAFFSQTHSTCTLMINVIFNLSGQHSKLYNPLRQAQHALLWASLPPSHWADRTTQPLCPGVSRRH